MQLKKVLGVAFVMCFVLTGCQPEDEGDLNIIDKQEYEILVDVNQTKGMVSPLLMGFNTIYCFEQDALWEGGTGQIPALLKKVNTGVLRYPGGAVVNRYHWNNLNGQGWQDNWDPTYNPANDLPGTEFMDVDEYMATVTAIGAEPLMGINMGSGLKWNRVQDGIEEAVALVKYCRDKGYHVKYWYLDNEPYHHGANYTMNAATYAEQINLYATALKDVDPDIQLIANWDSKISSNTGGMKTVINNAGANIDIIEVHWYWEHGRSTFSRWLNDLPMSTSNQWYSGFDYVREAMLFKSLVSELGQSHIRLACNEWSLGPGPSDKETPSKFQSALMISEQFSQFIDAGLYMANFWGVHWPNSSGAAVNRYLLDPTDNYSVNPIFTIFELVGPAMGAMQVKSSSHGSGTYDIAVLDEANQTLYIYLLNKKQDADSLSTGIDLSGLAFSQVSATSFVQHSSDPDAGSLVATEVTVENGARLLLSLPRNSFTRLTVKL